MDETRKYKQMYGGVRNFKSANTTQSMGKTKYMSFAENSQSWHSCQILELSMGVEYLHQEGVIHGDIRGVRMLNLRPLSIGSS